MSYLNYYSLIPATTTNDPYFDSLKKIRILIGNNVLICIRCEKNIEVYDAGMIDFDCALRIFHTARDKGMMINDINSAAELMEKRILSRRRDYYYLFISQFPLPNELKITILNLCVDNKTI